MHTQQKNEKEWSEQQQQTMSSANLMPPPNQLPAPGQRIPLSRHRVESTIPRGDFTPAHQEGAGNTWSYPSEQMFFNAMKRKGHEAVEEDMKAVVAIHNVVNERAWQEVLQ